MGLKLCVCVCAGVLCGVLPRSQRESRLMTDQLCLPPQIEPAVVDPKSCRFQHQRAQMQQGGKDHNLGTW